MMMGAVTIPVTASTINPFVASATPPDGYVFVAGDITLIIPVKSGSFGSSQSVTVQITAEGAITESIAGTVETAIQAAGYVEADTVTMTAKGVETVVYVPPAGLVVLSRSIDRRGQNGVNTNTITHANMAITQAATQLIALEVYRGIGNINGTNFNIDGVAATELATPRTIQTAGRARLRGITNASVDALATVDMIGVAASTSASGVAVLFSVDGANTYSLTHVEAVTGARSLSSTVSVLPGDLLVLVAFSTSSGFTGLAWTGASEVSASTINGTVAHYSAVAVQDITTTNAAYPIAINWSSGANNPALVATIIRHV